MTAAEWDDLARLAEAATVGEWGAQHRESLDWLSQAEDDETHQPGSSVHNGDPGNPLFGTLWPHRNGKADAEFIAAANPAAILRLIEAARRAEDYNAEAERHAARVVALEAQNEDLTAERDELAARLTAVEAEADTLDADLAAADPAHFSIGLMRGHLKTLRAVLSAAPTDTTKETP